MRIERRNTTAGQSPYAQIDFRLTTSEIRNPDGSVVFRLENVKVPDTAALADLPESERYVGELSAKQVFDRLAGC
jgi:ribonucleoside-diphosphate reductase alpha chain